MNTQAESREIALEVIAQADKRKAEGRPMTDAEIDAALDEARARREAARKR